MVHTVGVVVGMIGVGVPSDFAVSLALVAHAPVLAQAAGARHEHPCFAGYLGPQVARRCFLGAR